MAINVQSEEHRGRLAESIRLSYEWGERDRATRRQLIEIYSDYSAVDSLISGGGMGSIYDRLLGDLDDDTALLNYFVLFVRGLEVSLAFQGPRYFVKPKTIRAQGFHKRVQLLLDYLVEIYNFRDLVKMWAVDLAFGRAVAKTVTSVAPKGIHAPVAPRVYRLNPDQFIVDRAATSIDTASYLADFYFVPLEEARAHFRRRDIPPYGESADLNDNFPGARGESRLFAQDMCRLIDVYIPHMGTINTWPCQTDNFSEITQEPLQELPTPINPYSETVLLINPDKVDVLSRLRALKRLHITSNNLWDKSVQQAMSARKHPITSQGNEDDLWHMMNTKDTDPLAVSNVESLQEFALTGPDPTVLNLGILAGQVFSQHAGNLETMLGISPGADTARQTGALISQISQSQSVDRVRFEAFLAEIGKKLTTLAFADEFLALELMQPIPGTKYMINMGWAPPHMLPRVGTVHDYEVGVTPFSTAYETPEQRIMKLYQSSQLIAQMMALKLQGAPIDLGAVIEDVAEAFDPVAVRRWWNGQEPSPSEKAMTAYTSAAKPPGGGSVRRYVSEAGGGQNMQAAEPSQ